MKNIDLFELQNGIKAVEKLKWGKFSYAMIKNEKKIINAITNLRKQIKMIPEYREYLIKKNAIEEKYKVMPTAKEIENKTCECDKKKTMLNNKEKDAEIQKLDKEYAVYIKKVKDAEVKWEGLLKGEVSNIEFHKIKQGDLPVDLTPELTRPIFDLII